MNRSWRNAWIGSWKVRFLAFALKAYRYLLSPALHLLAGAGSGCRFEPTCSHYAEVAFSRFSPMRAFRLTAHRILRCHPLSRSRGWDPVPETY